MIILGDFAYPFDGDEKLIGYVNTCFLSKDKVLNFESTVSYLNGKKRTSGIALSSSQKAFNVMNHLNVKGVTLANNHIMDYEYCVESFLQEFDERAIQTTGLGSTLEGASKPMEIGEYVFLNFGWEVIGCPSATIQKSGCNPFSYRHIMQTVKKYLETQKNKKIVIIFHWNYEFELYPQPAHRKLAKELIDMGGEAVVGHHSHVIQGAELYKGKPIIYGLGNFYLPKYNYDGYYLDFKDEAYTGLAVDIETLDSYLIYSHDNKLSTSDPIPLFENKEVMQVSEFAGMSDEDYLLFFKTNRKKKKLLPIYNSWGIRMMLNDRFVAYRQGIIDLFVRLNLKKHKK